MNDVCSCELCAGVFRRIEASKNSQKQTIVLFAHCTLCVMLACAVCVRVMAAIAGEDDLVIYGQGGRLEEGVQGCCLLGDQESA